MVRQVSVSVFLVVTLVFVLSATALAAHNVVTFRIYNATGEPHRVTITSAEEGEKRLNAVAEKFDQRLTFNATAWWLKSETHTFHVEIVQSTTNRRICTVEYSLVNSYHFYAAISDWNWKHRDGDSSASTECWVHSTNVWREHDLADTASTIVYITTRKE